MTGMCHVIFNLLNFNLLFNILAIAHSYATCLSLQEIPPFFITNFETGESIQTQSCLYEMSSDVKERYGLYPYLLKSVKFKTICKYCVYNISYVEKKTNPSLHNFFGIRIQFRGHNDF